MKIRMLIASLLLMGASLGGFAQGIKDGIDFYKIKDYENAMDLLKRNLNGAEKSEAYYYLGQTALAQGYTSQAEEYFNEGYLANPKYPYNYVGQGALALKEGKKGEAEDHFKNARKNSKKDPGLEVAIARAYYEADPVAYAKPIEEAIKKARKYNAEDPDSWIFEGDRRADKAQTSEEWGSAAAEYERAFMYDNNCVEAYVKYADTYYKVNPDYAINRLKEILKNQTNSALVQRQLAEKLYEYGAFEEAADQYGQYVNNSPNHFNKDIARYAQLLFVANKNEKTVEVAKRLSDMAAKNDPYQVVAKRLEMYSLVRLERYKEAAEVGEELFDVKVESTLNHYNAKDYEQYGYALANSGKNDEALKVFEKALELDPSKVNLLRNLVSSAIDAKEYSKALAYGQKVLDSDGRQANDLVNMAEAYRKMAGDENTDEATRANALAQGQAFINEALGKDGGNIYGHYVNVMLQILGSKDLIPATTNMINAINATGDVAKYKDFLAFAYQCQVSAYADKNMTDKCVEVLRKWVALDPSNTTAQNALQQLTGGSN